jgi:hypothetical protein
MKQIFLTQRRKDVKSQGEGGFPLRSLRLCAFALNVFRFCKTMTTGAGGFGSMKPFKL